MTRGDKSSRGGLICFGSLAVSQPRSVAQKVQLGLDSPRRRQKSDFVDGLCGREEKEKQEGQ